MQNILGSAGATVARTGPPGGESKVGCSWWAIFWRVSAPIWFPVCLPLAFGQVSFAFPSLLSVPCVRQGHWAVLGQSIREIASPDQPCPGMAPSSMSFDGLGCYLRKAAFPYGH